MLTSDLTDDDTRDVPLPASNGSSNQGPTTSTSSSFDAEPVRSEVVARRGPLLPSLRLPEGVDQTTVQEFLVHLYQFFDQLGFSSVADGLKRELETQQLTQFGPFSSDLLGLLSRFNERTNAAVPPILPGLNARLFASERTSLMRRSTKIRRGFAAKLTTARPPIDALASCSALNVLKARELGVRVPTRLLQRKTAFNYEQLADHGKFQGHVMPAYCVSFDQTGRFILTGSDDKLIKVWDTINNRLRYTFRGCTGEVCDLTINMENTCLAAGSNDKIVRAWRLSDGQPVMVYKRHSAVITAVRFVPFAEGDVRYMVSTGRDCMVVFYRYNAKNLEFDEEPIRYEEREQRGAQMLSSCHSPGGNFVVMGDSAHFIHIYQLHVHTVQRITEFCAHSDVVDSLAWSARSFAFATGSKDGTAKIWRFSSGDWAATELRVTEPALPPAAASQLTAQETAASRRNGAYKVSMLNWNSDDRRLVTTGSDFLVRVWDAQTGVQLSKLEGHTDVAYVVQPHPIHFDLVFTTGHDGMIILWDIAKGRKVWSNRNFHVTDEQPEVTIPVFDLTVSPLGERFAYVDALGLLSVWGVGENRGGRRRLLQQFFSNDYDPLQIDQVTGFVYDPDGTPVHLSAPPMLVNIDMHPYGPEEQRSVYNHNNSSTADHSGELFSLWSNETPIVPPLSAGALAVRRAERDLQSQRELDDYEKGKPVNPEEVQRRQQAVMENERARRAEKLSRARESRRTQRIEREQRMAAIYEPQQRYVIDDSWTDAEDEDYSLGDDEQAAAREEAQLEDSDELTDENLEDFIDDCDSDYEIGRVERETVHRSRTALTVTGRPKRQPANRNSNGQGTSSSQATTSSSPQQPNTTRSGRQPRVPRRLNGTEYTRPRRRRSANASAPLAISTRRTRGRAMIESGSPVSSVSPAPGPSHAVERRVVEEEADEQPVEQQEAGQSAEEQRGHEEVAEEQPPSAPQEEEDEALSPIRGPTRAMRASRRNNRIVYNQDEDDEEFDHVPVPHNPPRATRTAAGGANRPVRSTRRNLRRPTRRAHHAVFNEDDFDQECKPVLSILLLMYAFAVEERIQAFNAPRVPAAAPPPQPAARRPNRRAAVPVAPKPESQFVDEEEEAEDEFDNNSEEEEEDEYRPEGESEDEKADEEEVEVEAEEADEIAAESPEEPEDQREDEEEEEEQPLEREEQSASPVQQTNRPVRSTRSSRRVVYDQDEDDDELENRLAAHDPPPPRRPARTAPLVPTTPANRPVRASRQTARRATYSPEPAAAAVVRPPARPPSDVEELIQDHDQRPVVRSNSKRRPTRAAAKSGKSKRARMEVESDDSEDEPEDEGDLEYTV
ncbi:hypothetical protein M3Y99_00953600 [Aphelenchoides fujianensis]|nr:hypothetical protein M3Y99_00953600 [Aphelenchoides fujianensis]